MQNEESLCFRVLKAKYFPKVDAKLAEKGHKASFLWNSLLQGKKVVDQGTFWRVGNGQRIDVWQDKWVRKHPDFKVELPQVQPTPLKVEKLIDTEKREWKADMISQMLNASDAELVMKIPLSKKSMPDKLIWRDSINGIITVKSAYYEARRQLEFEKVDRSSRCMTWKIVWMAKVAPKVKKIYLETNTTMFTCEGQFKRERYSIGDCLCGMW